MSTTLPPPPSPAPPRRPMASGDNAIVDGADFLRTLLDDQQSLSAVETFSEWHGDQPAQAEYYRGLMPATPPSADEQYAFEVDLDKCSGCKACVVACHTMNGLEETEAWRRVGAVTLSPSGSSGAGSSLSERGATITHVTTACHHCEDPGCLIGCPVKAYQKEPDTGIVRHLDDQCIGCKYCTMMCPYEVPRYSDRLGIVRKCDMCHQRLSHGEAPACVQACPNEAIAITKVKRDGSFGDDQRLAPSAPLSNITRPTTRYVGRDVAIDAAMPQDEGVDSPAESHWPLAALLVATQAGVGMLAVERLASLVVDTPVRAVATVALVVSAIGLNLAPLHLGQPFRAWRVFLGLRTSWLSREAVILGKFTGMLAAAVTLLWLPAVAGYLPAVVTDGVDRFVPPWAASALLWAAVPAGVAGLYSSGMIYVATRRELWRWSRTMIRCAGSAVALGAAGYAAVSGSAVAAVVAVGVTAAKVAWEWRLVNGSDGNESDGNGRSGKNESNGAARRYSSHSSQTSHDARSSRLVRGPLLRVWNARLTCGVAGVVIGLLGALSGSGVVLAAGFVAVLAGEFAERLLYFMAVVYDRMPGTLR